MTPEYTKWLWSNATPIETTPKPHEPIGRYIVFGVIVCAIHAIVWSV